MGDRDHQDDTRDDRLEFYPLLPRKDSALGTDVRTLPTEGRQLSRKKQDRMGGVSDHSGPMDRNCHL